MIRKLRIKITLAIFCAATLLISFFLVSAYRSSARTLEDNCYSIMNYILSDPASYDETTYPIAVVSVDYAGHMSLLLNRLTNVGKQQIFDTAENVLQHNRQRGEMDRNLRFMRKSIGFSNIRIVLTDISSERQILAKQRENYLIGWIFASVCFLFLGILISHWAAKPVDLAMKAQKQFMANASHELKTPLAVVVSNLDMLDTESLTPKDQDRIRSVQSEAGEMNTMITELLQIARYDSTIMPVEHSDQNLSDITEMKTATYEPLAFDKDLSLQSNIQEGIHVQGNESRLGQLLEILLENALKYCAPHGSIQVSLNRSGLKSVLLCVSNTGTPIAPDELKQIFSCFYRSRDVSESSKGNGLGLFIASQIVEDAGGKIWAESKGGINYFYVKFVSD